MWKATFEDTEPVDLNYIICAIEYIRVGVKKPVLGTLYNDAAEVGCSG